MTSIAQFAEAYIRRYGIAVVQIEPGTKGPRGTGWNKPGGYFTDPAAAGQFFSKHADWNMGAVLGPSGLCSLDVDDVEAARVVLSSYDIDVDALADSFPTIVGNPARFRISFHVPAGVELARKSLTWPNQNDPDGSKHAELIRQSIQAKQADDLVTYKRLREEAKQFSRMTVIELRAGDVQDVLPPSMHPGTGKPYTWRTKPNGHFPELPAQLLALWQDWPELRERAETLCPWRPKQTKKPATEKQRAVALRDGMGVIETYNTSQSIENALESFGYERHGERWLSPHSSTGDPGIWIQKPHNRAWNEHASDPLCSTNEGRPVSPFDLFCYYEHGGDVKKAVKAAAELLVMASVPVRREPVRREPPANVDTETGEILDAPAFDPPSDVQAPLIFSAKPMQAAELFKDSLPEGGRIIFWRGEFYSWDGSRYVIRDKVYIEQRLYHWSAKCETWKVNQQTGDFEVVPFDPTAKKVNDFSHALRAVCYSDLPEPQCWIDPHPSDPPAGEIIAFRNGFLHWPTRTIMPSTDRLFVTSCLDFDYDPQAAAPATWLTFLRALWSDDQESIDALADMFGYLLTDDTSQQKMFMFIGPPRSGKGTILRVLESMIGYSNRVSPSLSSIGTQFGLQPLIGKRLAMISDARLSGRADQQPIVENMLRISGEDALSIDRKNISAWTGKLPTRFVLAANELPAFSDASAALANRFILFRFTQSFLGREDMSLTGKLLKELPGIVLWALDGLERLQERGYLLRPNSANELAEDMIEQTSPIRAFVADRCVIGEIYQCTRDELFKEWKLWCEEQGRDHPGIKAHFGRMLSAAFPTVSRAQPRENGARLNLYQGIKIRGIYDRDY